MPTSPAAATYQAYLLRIWQADATHATASAGWQASLQDATTNQRIGFACLEELFAFLMQMTEPDIRLRKGDFQHESDSNHSISPD